VRKIGETQQQVAQPVVQLAGLEIKRLGPVGRSLEGREQLLGRLLGALPAGDFLGLRVPFGPQRFAGGHHRAPAAIQLERRLENLPDGRIAPANQGGPHAIGILAQQANVDHRVGSPSSRPRYPQFKLVRIRNRTERSASLKPRIRSLP
jgi:hypothetical protein